MNTDPAFYLGRLYPLQDRILSVASRLDTEFYLTGGTAASRGYLHHRLSDDLDLFVNDDDRFTLWANRVTQAFAAAAGWRVDVLQREARFVRLDVTEGDVALKIEMVNDVPAHVGEVRWHPTLGRLDSPENILANKISAAVDRREPKDLADIWGFCYRLGLSCEAALADARSKAAGLFPADVARVLLSVTRSDWELIRWRDAPPADRFIADLQALGERLVLPGSQPSR